MNWHYGQPIVNGSYICCVKGYDSPTVLEWNKDGQPAKMADFARKLPKWQALQILCQSLLARFLLEANPVPQKTFF